MNPGPTEEAGKVATGLVDALKGQPAVLALLVMVIVMMTFIFYTLRSEGEFRDSMLKQRNEYQLQVIQLLSKCVVPDGRDR